ncbi:hypothetical protein [Caudoviricetes sp.]|nr:hypothetical protein [Caudoviricetes sp.]
MTTSRTISKVLAGAEDLLLGAGTATQNRNGNAVPISKLNLPFVFTSIANIKAADTTKHNLAFLNISNTTLEYRYDSTSTATADDDLVLQPAVGSGRWLRNVNAIDFTLATGTTKINHVYGEAPTYIKTVSDILNGDEVSLNRFLSASKIANIKSNTGVVDVTTELQTWSSALVSGTGGSINFMRGRNYQISSTITNSQLANWDFYGIRAEDGAKVTSTIISGAVFEDSSQNMRLENFFFAGAGKTTPTSLFKGQLTHGYIRGNRINEFGKGIHIFQSAGALIECNNIGNCGSGIAVIDSGSDFSNIIQLNSNWIDFCVKGIELDHAYGVCLQSNKLERNDYHLHAAQTREISLTGVNWLEADNINPLYFTGACTGTIGRETHILSSHDIFVDKPNCAITNEATPDSVILKKSSNQALATGVPTSVTWQTEQYDPANLFNSSTSTTNVFIGTRGNYRVEASFKFSSVAVPAANSYIKVDFYDIATIFATHIIPIIAGVPMAITVSSEERFINTSQIGVQITQNSGATIDIFSDVATKLSINLVRAEF